MKKTSTSTYVVDDSTKRLIGLCNIAESDRSEDDIDEIIALINEKAPKIFEGVTDSNKENIARTSICKCYDYDEVVFQQGDFPDAYYTVIRGAVSIYARNSTNTDGNERASDIRSRKYGKYLVQLPPGASFGELSFNADYNHSRRNAGVISDGNHGQTRVKAQSGMADGVDDVEASNISVLLLVPEKTYMTELYARHSTKHHTKDKVAFLRESLIFKQWSMDELVKMAYIMKKKQFPKGSVVAKQGERSDVVWLIEKGKLAVTQYIVRNTSKKDEFNERDDIDHFKEGISQSIHKMKEKLTVDIAELGPHDIFGIVEALTNEKKMRRQAYALSNLEMFYVHMDCFVSFMKQEPKTFILLDKVVQKRLKWEHLRRDFAFRFPHMPLSLPKNAAKMSNYAISRDSTMSEQELIIRNKREKDLFRIMREIRSMFRILTSNSNTIRHRGIEVCQYAN
jgi:CRP-like cAMP-binding protein